MKPLIAVLKIVLAEVVWRVDIDDVNLATRIEGFKDARTCRLSPSISMLGRSAPKESFSTGSSNQGVGALSGDDERGRGVRRGSGPSRSLHLVGVAGKTGQKTGFGVQECDVTGP